MVFAEALTEYLIDGLSEALAQEDEPTPPVPLVADRYVLLSAMQKSIRRGHENLALRAAANPMIGGPHAIWRRLGIIAFEDVGVANIDAVGWATVLIGKPEVRKRLGAEWKVMCFLIRALCRSAKCRATDDLVHLIERDPALTDLRDELPGMIAHYNHRRYHESLSNLTPADVYFGRGQTILIKREKIKRQTIEHRRLQHRKSAA